MINPEELKLKASLAALEFIKEKMIIGVGTGSTINYFIDNLKKIKNRIEGAIPSSKTTADRLKAQGIPVIELNSVIEFPFYFDGFDEINKQFQMIKGAAGALTGEKIVSSVARQMVGIADETKAVDYLGKRPVPVEVIPMARSYVAREIVKLGGQPVYRQGFISDYGNIILDVHNLKITHPIELEERIDQIVGVVTNGLFAKRPADYLVLGTQKGVSVLKR